MKDSAESHQQRVAILGSTGSIGVSTLEVIAAHPERFEVFALSAATQVDKNAGAVCPVQTRFGGDGR